MSGKWEQERNAGHESTLQHGVCEVVSMYHYWHVKWWEGSGGGSVRRDPFPNLWADMSGYHLRSEH